MIKTEQRGSVKVPWAATKGTSLVTVQEFRRLSLSSGGAEKLFGEPLFPHAPNPCLPLVLPDTQAGGDTQTHEKVSKNGKVHYSSKCPVATEFQQARKHHSVLASTGCTKDFCQAGRAVHTDEPRVGENRAVEVVLQEAEGFLRELHHEHFFGTDEAFTNRLTAVLGEIKAGSGEGLIRQGRRRGTVGGNWLQTPAEVEFGIRRAWRNARKCIMRSHSDELK
ncbi:MAG: hypothetical protein L6R39_004438 [Caloplaca ligustica]|nr:MAG: hypothetical protein L6R39_004438 [Caloplaca ligustica]